MNWNHGIKKKNQFCREDVRFIIFEGNTFTVCNIFETHFFIKLLSKIKDDLFSLKCHVFWDTLHIGNRMSNQLTYSYGRRRTLFVAFALWGPGTQFIHVGVFVRRLGHFFQFLPRFLADRSLRAQIDNNTDRRLDVVFSRLRGFSFTIIMRQRPKGVTRMLSICLVIQRCLHETPLGFCLRVVVNEKPLNLEEVLLIYVQSLFGWKHGLKETV